MPTGMRNWMAHTLLVGIFDSASALEKSLTGFVFVFVFKLHMHLSYNPEFSLLDIYPREMKTYLHVKICT